VVSLHEIVIRIYVTGTARSPRPCDVAKIGDFRGEQCSVCEGVSGTPFVEVDADPDFELNQRST
jgi:hypothetical protein